MTCRVLPHGVMLSVRASAINEFRNVWSTTIKYVQHCIIACIFLNFLNKHSASLIWSFKRINWRLTQFVDSFPVVSFIQQMRQLCLCTHARKMLFVSLSCFQANTCIAWVTNKCVWKKTVRFKSQRKKCWKFNKTCHAMLLSNYDEVLFVRESNAQILRRHLFIKKLNPK